MVSGTCFFVLHSATKVTQCPRKTIGKFPQCRWMPSSEETGALVLIFFLDVVGFVCHSRCVSLFSVQCSHRCGWFWTRGCSVKSVRSKFNGMMWTCVCEGFAYHRARNRAPRCTIRRCKLTDSGEHSFHGICAIWFLHCLEILFLVHTTVVVYASHGHGFNYCF